MPDIKDLKFRYYYWLNIHGFIYKKKKFCLPCIVYSNIEMEGEYIHISFNYNNPLDFIFIYLLEFMDGFKNIKCFKLYLVHYCANNIYLG